MQAKRMAPSLTSFEVGCSNFLSTEDKGIFKVFGSGPESSTSSSPSSYHDSYFNDVYPAPDMQSWNSYTHIPHEPYYSYETTLLQPSIASLQKQEHIPRSYAAGSSCSTEPFLFPGTEPALYRPAVLSPASTSTYSECSTPSPMQLNEFANVFESDFSMTTQHHRYPILEHRLSLGSAPSLPPQQHQPRRSSYCSPSLLPPHSPRNLLLHTLDHPQRSREASPTSSSSDSGDQKRRFPCVFPGCSRRFTSQYTLKVHTEAHKPKPRASYPCTLGCSESFSRQHDRLRHEVAKHGKVCEFSCEDCGRFFSSGKTLGNHKCPVAQNGTRWVHH